MYADKLPPHDIQAEEAVVASILIDPEAILKVMPILRPEDFYGAKPRTVYEACLAVFRRGEPIDQISVTNELASRKKLEDVGGAGYLAFLIASLPTSVHAEYYANTVARLALYRELIKAGFGIASLGYEASPDTGTALAKAENLLFSVGRHRSPHKRMASIRGIVDEFLEGRRANEPIALTGWPSIDAILGGLRRGDLIVVAARPGVGKSAFVANIALRNAKDGRVVAIFSLEMGREQLLTRFIAAEAGINSRLIDMRLYSENDEQRIVQALGTLSDLKIVIYDDALLTPRELWAECKRCQVRQGLELLVVDYLQLMRGDRRYETRVQEITDISRFLKTIAVDLNIPVIAVSQLSRAVEMRQSHRPILSDLRESGSIEQDADIVMFLYREDMYVSKAEWERQNPGKPYPKNVVEVIIAKHRHGPLGSAYLYFVPTTLTFLDKPLEEANEQATMHTLPE